MAYLDSAHVCVLSSVLVLIQPILREFALPQVDAELNKEEHDGLQRRDGAVAGAFRRDMFVQER